MKESIGVTHANVPAGHPGARWGKAEWFIVVLFISSGLLLVPGTQPLRIVIRAAPYLMSLGMLLLYPRPRDERLPPGGMLLVLAMLLLAVEMFHPNTAYPAGLAQLVMQLSIAAPIFWGARAVSSLARLNRVIWVVLLVNGISVTVGLLQVFFPERLMPPELSIIVPESLSQLTYYLPNGRQFVRPPGLSDLPGGSAIAGMMTVLLGCAMGVQPRQKTIVRLLCFGAAGIGLVILFLTSARALLLMSMGGVTLLFSLLILQGRWKEAQALGLVAVAGFMATFLAAVQIGGAQIIRRFSEELLEQGIFQAYAENRGGFLATTFNDYLYRYPLGAGVGRWGMMRLYLGGNPVTSKELWVEVQPTGWLFDGGVLMWLFYGGAVVVALLYAARVAVSRNDSQLAFLALVILCLQVAIAGSTLAGPIFNTTMGIQFWMLTAALYGAERETRVRRAERMAQLEHPAQPVPVS